MRWTRAMAASLRMPVGLPSLSRSIFSARHRPSCFGRSAGELHGHAFTRAMCPSSRHKECGMIAGDIVNQLVVGQNGRDSSVDDPKGHCEATHLWAGFWRIERRAP